MERNTTINPKPQLLNQQLLKCVTEEIFFAEK